MQHRKMVRVVSVLLFVGFVLALDQMPASAQRGGAQMPAGVQASKLGDGTMVLADAKGMTLYTYANDMPGVSNCNDNCAKNWPPVMAAADAKPMGDWTIVTRADGTKQWAYKTLPIYGWIKDAKPGDNTGNGMGMGAWKTAVP